MSAFDNRWDNWAGDFAESYAATQLPAVVREGIGAILTAFGEAMRRESPEFPDVVTPGAFAKVLKGGMPRLDLPDEARPLVPEVIAAFLDDLQDTGRLGDGAAWAEQIRTLAGSYRERQKPGGGALGVTIRNPSGTSTTGRNDPCPCGSGKKFKKCCLAKP